MRNLAISLLVFLILGLAQEPSRFAGTWEARLGDSVVCTIRLAEGDRPSGSVHRCRVNVDAEGNLVEAEPSDDGEDKPMPIANARIEREVLTFATKDKEDAEGMKFEMTLAGNEVAHLRFTNAPVKIKPIRFTRVGSRR